MWEIFNSSSELWDRTVKENSFTYRQLSNWSEYKKSHNWANLKLIFSSNNQIINYASVFFKKKFKIIFMYIPGGLKEDKNIDELIEYVKKFNNCKYYYIRIDDNKVTKNLNESYNVFKKNYFNQCLFRNNKFNKSLRTYLTDNIETKLKKIDPKWRAHYKKAIKNEIIIKTEHNPDLKSIMKLSEEMEKYKDIKPIHSIEEVKSMLKYFRKELIIKTAYKNDKLIGFRMAFLFEKFGWDIYGATSEIGREFKAGYVLLWSIIEECYKKNIRTYDIGGLYDYNKRHFKMGITDEVASYYGEYEKTNLFLLDKIISIILKIRGTQFLNK
jgi:lipid II:glycine glycyltransferase (peptidoglycan interpeptide bridge formation enzyme)